MNLMAFQIRRGETRLLDAVGAFFHHATPGLGPAIEIDQNADWGNKQKEVALAGMHYFDETLGANPFVAGESFSMADITVFAGLGFADFAKIEIPASCAKLNAWRDRVSQRPSVAG